MAKISDYNIFEILAAAGTETWKIGTETVCRCPVCKGDNNKKAGHNAIVNINSDPEKSNVFCLSGCGGNKGFTRTKLVDSLNLRERLNIPKFLPKDEFIKQNKQAQIEYKPEPAPAPAVTTAEIERLLKREIPPVLWNLGADSFKNIKLIQRNGSNRLLITAPNGSTIIRNAGDVKWKWKGHQPIFNHITGKDLIFLASGIAEWLILDWLGLDYIVLPSDSLKGRLVNYRENVKNKAVIILPDKDIKSSSFDKVIEIIKTIAERVHIANFYDDHDFRDYARRTAPAFENKEQFLDSLLYNIFIELDGSESTEIITENDIYNLIPIQEPEQEHDKEPDTDEYEKTIIELLDEVRPELILNKYYNPTSPLKSKNP